MKKLIFVFVVLLALISSCSKTPEQKAQQSIKDYLQKNLNDAKSYESVEFGTLLFDSTSYDDTEAGKIFKEIEYKYEYDSIVSGISNELQKEFIESKQKYEDAKVNYDTELLKFKPEFKGYTIRHKYRGKNKMGGVVLESKYFIMDKEFKIIRVL